MDPRTLTDDEIDRRYAQIREYGYPGSRTEHVELPRQIDPDEPFELNLPPCVHFITTEPSDPS
jgi:hypothetical protein